MELVERKDCVKPRRGCWIHGSPTTVSRMAMEGFAVADIDKRKSK
ncbi:hypothetical protein ACTQ43_07505 [Segatella copri]|nr:MAG TPA: hypothetical protein [Caudoviricetes sp.]